VLHDYVRVYAAHALPPGGVPGFLYFRRGGAFLLIACVLGLGGVLQARAERDREALEIGAWLWLAWFACAASIIAQGRYFAYHFVALAPFCAALCLYGLRQLYRSGEITREEYLGAFRGYSPYDVYARMERVAKQVKRRARAGDTLCVRGFLTPLYVMTGLSCTSRHIVQDIVDSGLPQWPAEYARDLELHPPSFIVTFVDRSEDLNALKAQGYRPIALEDGLVLFAQRARVAEYAARARRNRQ
jgi:hypothetical protein